LFLMENISSCFAGHSQQPSGAYKSNVVKEKKRKEQRRHRLKKNKLSAFSGLPETLARTIRLYLVGILDGLAGWARHDLNFILGLRQLLTLEMLDVLEPAPRVHKLLARNFAFWRGGEIENEWSPLTPATPLSLLQYLSKLGNWFEKEPTLEEMKKRPR